MVLFSPPIKGMLTLHPKGVNAFSLSKPELYYFSYSTLSSLFTLISSPHRMVCNGLTLVGIFFFSYVVEVNFELKK